MAKTKESRKHNPLLPKRKRGRPPKKEAGDPGVRGEEIREPKEPRKPRQRRLPEMEDPQIESLEALAEQYDAIKKKRVALTSQEVPLKSDLIKAMKENGKTAYHHNGITIKLVSEKENVKVVVDKNDDNPE